MGADVNAGDSIGQTPLHNARDLDTARLLVSLGADPNAVSNTGYTPLHLKVEDPEVVQFLISQGADANARSEWDETPLHDAAEYDERWTGVYCAGSQGNADEALPETIAARLQSAKILIEHGSDIGAQDDYGRTPLHIAIKWDFTEMAKLLLEWGADVKSTNGPCETPLHYCAQYSGRETAQALLSYGANVNARSKQGWYPLEMAVMHGRMDVRDLLRENGARRPKPAALLFQAVYEGDTDKMDELLSRRPRLIRARNAWRRTAVNVAVEIGFGEGIRLLLNAGADPNVKDDTNNRPLTIAVRDGGLEVARMLLEAGAKTSIGFWHVRSGGTTPLAEALERRDSAMAKLLIESGADVVTPRRGYGGKTILHLAAKRADLDTVKAIVERGADVNAVTGCGWTPICYAAAAGNVDIVRYLLESGAEINAGKRGALLLAAVGRNRLELLEFLISKGADTKSAARGGVSALHYAAVRGYTDSIAVLLDAGARINARLTDNWQGPLRKVAPKGTTPLGVALMAGQQTTADYLSERGAI